MKNTDTLELKLQALAYAMTSDDDNPPQHIVANSSVDERLWLIEQLQLRMQAMALRDNGIQHINPIDLELDSVRHCLKHGIEIDLDFDEWARDINKMIIRQDKGECILWGIQDKLDKINREGKGAP